MIQKTFYMHRSFSLKSLISELESNMEYTCPELINTHEISDIKIQSGLPRGDLGQTVRVTFVPRRVQGTSEYWQLSC